VLLAVVRKFGPDRFVDFNVKAFNFDASLVRFKIAPWRKIGANCGDSVTISKSMDTSF